jgi:hypothetical protein
MRSPSLPAEVRRSADTYLHLIDQTAPGLVEGLYVHGSLAYGNFRAGRSDIDFAAVLSERPTDATVALLRDALAELGGRHPRPYFDGLHVTRAELAAPPGECPDVPCIGEWDFQPAARLGLNPVTWHELAGQAITLRGPELTATDVWTDQATLRAFTHANLSDYWRPLLDKLRAGEEAVATGATERAEWITEWFVLGIARLHHLLATDRLTSKGGAGQHALTAFDEAWHPMVNEALRIRNGTPATSSGTNSAARVRDTIAFTDMVLEASLKLTP